MTKKPKIHQIKAIIFDLGNVLIFYDHLIAAKSIAKKSGVSEKKVFQVLSGEKSEFVDFCEKGVSENKYWHLFTKILKTSSISPKILTSLWNNIFWPNKPMLKLLSKLKDYDLGLISNIDKGHKNYLLKKYNLKENFKAMIFSCDIGIRKPSSKIYQTALNKLGARPAETIFIDDIEKNLIKAKKLGMHTILFKTNKQLFKQLKQLGVKI